MNGHVDMGIRCRRKALAYRKLSLNFMPFYADPFSPKAAARVLNGYKNGSIIPCAANIR